MDKLTCGSCTYFKNTKRETRVRGGKVKYTCKSIGVFKLDTPCEHFEIKPPDPEPNYQQLFYNMIVQSFNVEQDAEKAMELIIQKMKEKGFEVPMAKSKFRNYVDKLTVLHTLSQMIDVFSLTLHKEKILEQEIIKLFQPRATIAKKV